MRKDAELHAEEDKKRKEEIETRNEADNAVYRSEKIAEGQRWRRFPALTSSKIEDALNEVKEALKGSDAAAIKTASEKLNEAWQAVSAELYKAASEKARAGQGAAGGQSGTQPEAGGTPEGGKEDESPIIDAEVVEEKKAA